MNKFKISEEEDVVEKKSLLLITNLAICLIVLLGIALFVIITFKINTKDYKENIEKLSFLASECVYCHSEKIFEESDNIMISIKDEKIQALLNQYKEKYGVKIYIVDEQGKILINEEKVDIKSNNFFIRYDGIEEDLLSERDIKGWYSDSDSEKYIVARYLPRSTLYIIIEHDTVLMKEHILSKILGLVFVGMGVLLANLGVINYAIGKYKKRLTKLTLLRVKERQKIFRKATEEMYEDIYEMNITKNCAADKKTEKFFESVGLSKNAKFDDAIKVIAEKQIIEEHRKGYLSTFSTTNILREYNSGNTHLNYEFLYTKDGVNYGWLCIEAYLYYLSEDKTIRMLAYRRNIDEMKKREIVMSEKIEIDAMTKIYNKAATEKHIKDILKVNQDKQYAFIIFDIDNFKSVNDRFGHAFGDYVIIQFTNVIKNNFRHDDIVGRIGGDEFVVFVEVSDIHFIINKIKKLSEELNMVCTHEQNNCKISGSIGISMFPKDGRDFESLYKNADIALYKTKESGKNGYNIYNEG